MHGLPVSSEFSEDQTQGWELNIHLGRGHSASPANVTVKVTGLKPSGWGWGLQAAQEPTGGNCALGAQLQTARPAGPPLRSSSGAGLYSSAPLPSEFLGPSEPRKLDPGVQHVSTTLGTPDVPEEPTPPPPGSVARQRRLERREEPQLLQGRADTRAAPPRTRVLGLPGWGGAETAKVAVADLVKPGGARPAATHLSRVYRRADPAGALLLNSCGPRRVAGAQPLPLAARVWRRRAPVGAGRGPEPRARARDSACSSLPPSPRVAAQLSPAVRSALWGAARGPRPRGGGSAWG